jgi:hypothetical protein
MLPIPRWKDGLLWIFGLLLLAAFLGVFAPRDEVQAQVGPPNQILCNHLAQASPTAVTSQVLSLEGASGSQPVLRGVAGLRIYICGWHVTATAGTSSSFQLVAGTDSATTPGCGGTQTIITPAYTVLNTAPATDHIEYATFSLAAGQQLCVTTVGTALQVGVWIGQY